MNSFYYNFIVKHLNTVSKEHRQTIKEDLENGVASTLNKMGYMSLEIEAFSKKFLESLGDSDVFLELGAAYGVFSRQAAKRVQEIHVNDLDMRHLESIHIEHPEKMTLFPGAFPGNISLKSNFYDCAYSSRMFHLLDPSDLQESFASVFKALKPGGRFCLVIDTPYLKVFEHFVETYEQRVRDGAEWPGLIENASDHIDGFVEETAPKRINFMDPNILRRLATRAGFDVQEAAWIPQPSFPPFLKYDGRESAGILATKPL